MSPTSYRTAPPRDKGTPIVVPRCDPVKSETVSAAKIDDMWSRRDWLIRTAAMLPAWRAAAAARGSSPGNAALADECAAIERRIGGRLGVSILDTGSGRRVLYRADER